MRRLFLLLVLAPLMVSAGDVRVMVLQPAAVAGGPTIIETDFSGGDSAPPTGWTETWGSSGVVSGVIQLPDSGGAGGGGTTAASWDSSSSSGHSDGWACFVTPDPCDGTAGAGPGYFEFRFTDQSGTADGYAIRFTDNDGTNGVHFAACTRPRTCSNFVNWADTADVTCATPNYWCVQWDDEGGTAWSDLKFKLTECGTAACTAGPDANWDWTGADETWCACDNGATCDDDMGTCDQTNTNPPDQTYYTGTVVGLASTSATWEFDDICHGSLSDDITDCTVM